MKKRTTIFMSILLASFLLTGCAKAGIVKDHNPSVKDNKATINVADEILKSLDDLPSTQLSQTDAKDSDLLIP